jgi:hypothetical protein
VPATDGSDDFVGVGNLVDGFGMGLVIIEESIDGGLEVGHRAEDAAFETRMAGQPLAHGGMLVGGVIVEDRVDGLSGGNLSLDRIKKANELLVTMALHVAPDHGSVEDVHRREQVVVPCRL